MNRKGSITIYLSLMLTVMISLICTSILSVKVSACRMQLANAADQAMFSLFAQYDRDLLDRYDVFFVDGSCGSSQLSLGKCYDRLTDSMSYLLSPDKGNLSGGKNLFSLKEAGGSITGYTLATDCAGAAFAAQAIDYMTQTAGIQGIRLLKDEFGKNASIVQQQETEGGNPDGGNLAADYAELEAQAAREKTENEAAEKKKPVEIPPDFKNPMGEIIRVKATSILNLVCQDVSEVSGKQAAASELLSGRQKESGMGVIDVSVSPEDAVNSLWLDEYLLTHYGTYRKPTEKSGLSYQAEYMIAGKDSDTANLENVVSRLLLTREGVNILLIMTNSELRLQAETTAEILAAILLNPEAAPAIQAILTAGWAFCESLIDVRGLLDGDHIPLVKTFQDWQLQLSDVPGFSSRMDSFRRRAAAGTDYEDYLRIFLYLTSAEERVSRAMDMTESTIRESGRGNFRLDCCFDSLTVEMKAEAEGRKVFTTEKTMCYRKICGDAVQKK
ncbi:MAG: DUF5702 domain-containing protein [Lachnospiraceae bacterium]|nr:DUF5702 domain-containing protein [Lachnospiraceae bacterium]